MGNAGWEIATIIQTPILLQSSFTTYTIKLLMFFQRRLYYARNQSQIANGTGSLRHNYDRKRGRIVYRDEPGYFNHTLGRYVFERRVSYIYDDTPVTNGVVHHG